MSIHVRREQLDVYFFLVNCPFAYRGAVERKC